MSKSIFLKGKWIQNSVKVGKRGEVKWMGYCSIHGKYQNLPFDKLKTTWCLQGKISYKTFESFKKFFMEKYVSMWMFPFELKAPWISGCGWWFSTKEKETYLSKSFLRANVKAIKNYCILCNMLFVRSLKVISFNCSTCWVLQREHWKEVLNLIRMASHQVRRWKCLQIHSMFSKYCYLA